MQPDMPLSSIRFRGLIAPEEPVVTGDNRQFARGSLSHRRMPRPGMFSRVRGQRHEGAVAVSRLEAVQYQAGRGWVGEGTFLDPRVVPEVTEAVYLVRNGVSSPSVDLQPNVTAEIRPHPTEPDGHMARILKGRIMGFTFVPFAAFEEVEIVVSEEEDRTVLASAGIDLSTIGTCFAVNSSSWRRMPVAARDTVFEFESAIERILQWSRGQPAQFRQAFLFHSQGSGDTSRPAFHLPIADIIDSTLTLVPRAVFSAAVFMAGGHGGLPDISEREQDQIRNVITEIYDVLRERFGDPRIRPPWQQS